VFVVAVIDEEGKSRRRPEDEQKHGVRALLVDDCECGRGRDELLADASPSSFALPRAVAA
jgi:hypothetical protein